MSKLVTNTVRHTAGSADNITLDNSQNVTCENNLQVDGNVTVTGTLPADKLTGNLPAISGASLTGIPRFNRNLIINGAMQVAQRATSAVANGFASVDRWKFSGSYPNASALTQAQHALTSSDTGPWAEGFRSSYHLTNNSNSVDNNTRYMQIEQKLEAQDIANSGWEYTNTNSKITLSFWIKSSVAQTFYGRLLTYDGTILNYPFSTGSLSANTWTKVTKTIPGHASLQFDNNNAEGITIMLAPFFGTDFTDSGVSLNTWAAYGGGTRTPDYTSTWYTTNGATFEFTGVQLEVGSTATEFEHRSYADELMRCYRYFYMHASGADHAWANIGMLAANTASNEVCIVPFPTRMRTTPSLYKVVGTDYFRCQRNNGYQDSDDVSYDAGGSLAGYLYFTDDIASSGGLAGFARIADKSAARIGFDAEL